MIKNNFSNEESCVSWIKLAIFFCIDITTLKDDEILELYKGMQIFYTNIEKNDTKNFVEISIIQSLSDIKTILEPSLVNKFKMPKTKVGCKNKLIETVLYTIRRVEEQILWYKNTGQWFRRPLIIIITDNEFQVGQEIHEVHDQIQSDIDNKKYQLITLGVKDTNMNVLKQISSKKMPPVFLMDLKFSNFFQWLSQVIFDITINNGNEKKVNLPDLSFESFNPQTK